MTNALVKLPADMDSFAIILPAAGRSARFGGPRNKLLEPIAGIPVIRRAVNAFLQLSDVQAIVLATGAGQTSQEVLGANGAEPLDLRLRFTPGGDNRAQSVLFALRQIPQEITWVAVHDAARPLISQELIARTFDAAKKY